MGRPIRAALAALALLASAASASAGVLDRAAQDGTLRIGYREDAPPFSYKDGSGQPAGFMVDLCRAVVDKIAAQTGKKITPAYVAVTGTDRFDAVAQGRVDLLCESTSATLSRREKVDFSIFTFIDGASLLVRGDGPHELAQFTGKKVGVLAGTTTLQALKNSLPGAEIVEVPTHGEGIAMLDDGRLVAYFADRAILTFLARESRNPDQLKLAENYLTVEPYALALPRGDTEFRLAVDRALSAIYRGREIGPIFAHTFGAQARPSQLLVTVFGISALPE